LLDEGVDVGQWPRRIPLMGNIARVRVSKHSERDARQVADHGFKHTATALRLQDKNIVEIKAERASGSIGISQRKGDEVQAANDRLICITRDYDELTEGPVATAQSLVRLPPIQRQAFGKA